MSRVTLRPPGIVRGEEKPFFVNAKAGVLIVQRCVVCENLQFPARTVCTSCYSEELADHPVAGTGTVYSWTAHPSARATGPTQGNNEIFAIIELDEGPRIVSSIVGAGASDVAIGRRVYASFYDLSDQFGFPLFSLQHIDS